MQPTSSTYTGADGSVARQETQDLIASDKVEGTAVYDRSGNRIGDVYNFMVDKTSGKVAYAVISFGGFLGIGEDYFPLPWNQLSFDTAMGGYVVDIDSDRLETAPRYGRSETPWSDPAYAGNLDLFWGRPYAI
jgi:sporulation protein YlmC with PRC-barrel domain